MNKFEKIQINELEDFLSRMRYMDSDSLGGVAALVWTWADMLNEDYGWNMYCPHVVAAQNIDAALKIGKMVRYLQKQGPEGSTRAVGGLVWAHTIRACSNLKLTGGVREMWSHIERGFPYAEDSAINVLTGGELNHLWKFPDGFTPEPI